MANIAKVATIVLIISIMLMSVCYAEFTPNSITPASIGTTKVSDMAIEVMKWIRTLAVIAAVVILMLIGVKYIVGSVEEKAEYKKSLMPYFIGLVIIFSATQIVYIVYNNIK